MFYNYYTSNLWDSCIVINCTGIYYGGKNTARQHGKDKGIKFGQTRC